MIKLANEIRTERLVLRLADKADYVYRIYEKTGHDKPIGNVTLGILEGWFFEDEIVVKIDKPFRANGYAKEAVIALKDHAISCGITPWARAWRWDKGGNALALKTGFVLSKKGLLENTYKLDL